MESDSSAKTYGVLVVEDNTVVRNVTARILQSDNHQVFLAANADEALVVFEQLKHKIDIVILDVFMPGVGGPELYEILQRTKPSLPAIFVTGMIDSRVEAFAENMDSKQIQVLQKPYTKEILRETLAKLSTEPPPKGPG